MSDASRYVRGTYQYARPATAAKTEDSATCLFVIVSNFSGVRPGSGFNQGTTWPPELLLPKGLFRDLGSVNESSKG